MALPDPGTAAYKLWQTLQRHEDNARAAITEIAAIKEQLTGLEAPEGGDYIQEGDPRLTDPRQPLSHSHLLSDVTDAGTAAPLDVPASGDAAAGEVVKGDDSRLTDERPPVDHASDHESGGSDAIDHDNLTNYDIDKHRSLNDSSQSTTEVLSASKIHSMIAAVTAGVDYKHPVATSTEGLGNITLTGEQTLNGVTTSGSRVLVMEQTDGSENGIYVSDSGAWTRAEDADADAEVTNGMTTFVFDSNSTHFRDFYILTTADPITVDTSSLTFSKLQHIEFGDGSGQAIEGTNSRVPTQDENDALQGRSGTPSNSNRVILADDPLLPSSDENAALQGTNGTPADGNRFVTDSDPRNSDPRTPSAHASDHKHGGSDEIASATPVNDGIPKAKAGTIELHKDWLPGASESDKGAVQLAQNFEVSSSKPPSSNDDRIGVVCDAATTTDIDIDSSSPADTYDGVTLEAFDVLLVLNQTDASENGVYVFTDTSTPLSRYNGLNTSAGFAGRKKQFIVRDGDTQKGVYTSDAASGFTLDTDDLEFTCSIANPGREASNSDIHQFTQAGFYRDTTNDSLWVVWTDSNGTHRYRLNTEIHPFPERDFYGPPHKFGPRVISCDGGVIVIDKNAGYLVDGTTGLRYQFTLATIDNDEAFDVEAAIDGGNLLGLGATEMYSLLTGDSDTKGFNGDPLCMDLKVLAAGGVAPPMILSSKGDLPDGRMVGSRQLRQRAFLGDISEFMSFAQEGEEGQNNIADTAILDAAGNTLNTNLDADERFFCIRGAAPILDGTARHIDGVTSAVNLSKIRFTVPGVDLSQELSTDDHILIYGSDGENCNGMHQVTGVTFSSPDSLIDVNTTHTTGDATMGTIRALARLKKITSTVV